MANTTNYPLPPGNYTVEGSDAQGDVYLAQYSFGSRLTISTFVYANGQLHDFYAPGSDGVDNATYVSGVTQSGIVWGYVARPSTLGYPPANARFFIYQNGSFSFPQYALPDGTRVNALINSVDEKGDFAGTYVDPTDNSTHSFVNLDGAYSMPKVPGSISTTINGITANGVTYGNDVADAKGNKQGFLYANGHYTILSTPGAVSSSIDYFHFGNVFLGESRNAAGQRQSFVVDYAPGVTEHGQNLTITIGVTTALSVAGSGDVVVAFQPSSITIGGNGQYASDADDNAVRFLAPGSATVTDDARTEFFGDGITATIGNHDTVGIYGHGNHLTATGTDDAVWIGGNGRDALAADSDSVTFSQTGGALTVAENSRVDVTGDGLTMLVSGNDAVNLQGHDALIKIAGANFGQDSIQGFQAEGNGHDTLQFSSSTFASVAAILQAASQVGSDVVISASDHDVLRLQNVSLAALSSSNLRVA